MFNSQLTNQYLDIVMPVITDLHKITFIIYAVPVFLVLWLVRHRLKCVKTLMGIVVAVAMADATCYHLIKNRVKRDRPEQVMNDVILRTNSHSGYSFPSNHAANIFAGAFVVRYMYPGLRSFVYIFALLVAYSRIYVGVHFPFDVIVGSALGYFCGLLTIMFGVRIQPESWKYEPPKFAKS